MAKAETKKLTLDSIIQDENIQQRAGGIKPARVREYAKNMRNGQSFPPVIVFFDGKTYWLADGFHRCAAAANNEQADIEANIHDGGYREAILYAAGANAEHGVRRTNADKRKAVITLLKDDEWNRWTDHTIAKQTHTTQPFVSKLRKELSDESGRKKRQASSRGVIQQLSRTWKSADAQQKQQWILQNKEEIKKILEVVED